MTPASLPYALFLSRRSVQFGNRGKSENKRGCEIFLHPPTFTTDRAMKKQTIVTKTVQADGSIVTKTITQEVPASDDSFVMSAARRPQADSKRASRDGKKSIHEHVRSPLINS